MRLIFIIEIAELILIQIKNQLTFIIVGIMDFAIIVCLLDLQILYNVYVILELNTVIIVSWYLNTIS